MQSDNIVFLQVWEGAARAKDRNCAVELDQKASQNNKIPLFAELGANTKIYCTFEIVVNKYVDWLLSGSP